jgi:tryptophan synthase alpha subunit
MHRRTICRAEKTGQKGFVVYIGAGDPNPKSPRSLAFDKAGVDDELGVLSATARRWPVNQLAAQRGLESGTTPPMVLETVAAIRRESQVHRPLHLLQSIHTKSE